MKKNLISFHINAIWPEWNRFKISALLFWQFTFTVDMIFNELPGEWWIHFTFKRLLLVVFFIESPYFDWEFYQGFCLLLNMKMDEIKSVCKSGPVDFAWDTDFAHFLGVVRHSCTYTKTTIRLIGSLYFSEFYGN